MRRTTHPLRTFRRQAAEERLVARLEHLTGPGPHMRSMTPGDLLDPDEVEAKVKVNLQHLADLRAVLAGRRVGTR